MSGAPTPQAVTEISVQAGSDLSASQYCFVNVNSSAQLALPSAGGRAIGVLTNDPAAAGRAGTVQIDGVAKVLLGGTVTPGDDVKSDASGKAVTASAGDLAFGVCIKGGASGEYGEVLLNTTNFASGGAPETVSANGALSVVKGVTLLSVTGSKAYTIGAGLYAGQMKWIQCIVAASIPSGVVTGTYLDTDGTTARTTATFDAVADQLIMVWTGAAWQVLTKTSVTMG